MPTAVPAWPCLGARQPLSLLPGVSPAHSPPRGSPEMTQHLHWDPFSPSKAKETCLRAHHCFSPLGICVSFESCGQAAWIRLQVSRQGCVPACTLGAEEMLKDCYRQWMQPGGNSHLARTAQFVLNDRLCPEVFWGSFVSIEPSLISASAFHSRR